MTTSAGTGDANLTVSGGATLTFTTANWNTNQTVTLAAAQDADTTDGTRAFTVAAAGIPSVTVTATEQDDDVTVGAKVDNPYSGASGYVNPDWQAQVNAEANTRTGALANQMRNIASTPTAVWMDRIGAITAGRGLAGHLDAAVAQDAANGAAPVVVTLIIYDLPNRDCAALASNGELLIANGGMTRYQNEYITPIREILAGGVREPAAGPHHRGGLAAKPRHQPQHTEVRRGEPGRRLRGRRPVRGEPTAHVVQLLPVPGHRTLRLARLAEQLRRDPADHGPHAEHRSGRPRLRQDSRLHHELGQLHPDRGDCSCPTRNFRWVADS